MTTIRHNSLVRDVYRLFRWRFKPLRYLGKMRTFTEPRPVAPARFVADVKLHEEGYDKGPTLSSEQVAAIRPGDNVMIGSNSVEVGPIEICDYVQIAAMSLVNRSIDKPGTYVGTPPRRVDDSALSHIWLRHLAPPNQGA